MRSGGRRPRGRGRSRPCGCSPRIRLLLTFCDCVVQREGVPGRMRGVEMGWDCGKEMVGREWMDGWRGRIEMDFEGLQVESEKRHADWLWVRTPLQTLFTWACGVVGYHVRFACERCPVQFRTCPLCSQPIFLPYFLFSSRCICILGAGVCQGRCAYRY